MVTSFVLVIDVVGTWGVWGSAPTDTLRVDEDGFWSFAFPRIACCALGLAIGLLARLRFATETRRTNLHVFVFAAGVEAVATATYWLSPWSDRLRLHYEGMARFRWYRDYSNGGVLVGYLFDYWASVALAFCLIVVPAFVFWQLVSAYIRDAGH